MGEQPEDLIETIFHEVIGLPAEERERFVAEATHDEEIRREVISLLLAHDRAGAFLGRSAIDEGAHRDAVADRWIGQTIGRFRIIERIASGGMGTVYRGERADQAFEQIVAIKLIRTGMDTEDILNRFRHERQVLANLEHPNIARLLDGGSTEGSQPYLVMEFVEGTRLDEYADRHQLTIAQRLELFLHVCDAVQHAHRNLVIHRDLKPSNILVAEDGTVKLLDFGIAKVFREQVENPRDRARDVTATIDRRLTPAYASPEQVRGRPVTTATDVYSLGVILYELLTGHRPHRIENATIEEASRVICEQAPSRPSSVVLQAIVDDGSSKGDGEAAAAIGSNTTTTPDRIAARRSTDPARLQRALRGDLENIILMALRKEPQRRYASVEQLAEDIRRHQQLLPVIARPDTLRYRTARFAQRHRVAAAAAAAVFLAITAALVFVSMALSRAIEAEALAETRLIESQQAQQEEAHQRREAERQTRIAEAINQFLTHDLLLAVSADRAHAADVTVIEIIDNAAEAIGERFTDEPLVEAEIRWTIGNAYRMLSRFEDALVHLDLARDLFEREVGAHDERTLSVSAILAVLHYEVGNYEAAQQYLASLLPQTNRHLGEHHDITLEVQRVLCSLLLETARHDEADAVCRDMLTVHRALFDDDDARTQIALSYMARLHLEYERLEEAEGMYRDILAVRRRGDDIVRTTSTINNLAVLYIRMERYADAESMLIEALDNYRHFLGASNVRTMVTLGNLGRAVFEQGRFQEADAILEEAVSGLSRAFPDGHWTVSAFTAVRGSAKMHLGAFDEAERMLLDAYHSLALFRGADDERTRSVAQRLVDLYESWQDHDAAADHARRAVQWRQRVNPVAVEITNHER